MANPFKNMEKFLRETQQQQQMTQIQYSDRATYDKPDLFSQISQFTQSLSANKPQIDPEYLAKRQEKVRKEKHKYNEIMNRQARPVESINNKPMANVSLKDDFSATLKATGQFFNPFDSVSGKEAVDNFLYRNRSKAFDEIARGSSRATDSAALGAFSNLDKRINDRTPSYTTERPIGEGGVTDMATTGLGYLAPGLGALKMVKGTALGMKAIPSLVSGASKADKLIRAAKVGGQVAKEGVAIGTGLGLAEVGIREGLNPDDYNWKQNAGHVGLSAAAGAIADPLLYGVGKGLSKGADEALKKLIPDQPLPEFTGSVRPEILDKIANTQRKLGIEPGSPVGTKQFDNPQQVLDDMLAEPRVPERFEPSVPNDGIIPPKDVTPVKPDVELNQNVLKTSQQAVDVPNTNTPENVPNVPEQPENLPYVAGERKHYSTLANSEKAPDEFVEGIKNLDRKISNSLSDKDATDFANAIVKRDIEEAFQFVKNADIRDKRHSVVGFRLIDEFNKKGDFERAVDMADVLAREGTKAGQKLQSFSVYNRLSAEGQLIRVQRHINKLNEKAGVNGSKVELTEDMHKTIVATADSIQKLAGQEKLGKNVIDIVEGLKNGKAATDEETQIIKMFFEDAKKFVSDLDPKAKPEKVVKIKDVRTRDKVIEIMDKREQLAKEKLKQIMRRANSLPVDAFYALVDIGASKIAKGTVKFIDFSEQMIKEYGPNIKPYMQQIYNKAVETFNLQSSKMTTKRLTSAEKVVNKALKEKTLDETTAKEINRLLKQVVEATEGAKFEANMELQMALNSLERPTFGQKVSSFQTIMMLWNSLTMERNIIGNEAFYRTDRASRLLLAAPFDKARVKIFGGKRHIVLNSGQFKSWEDFFQPTKDYWKGLKMGVRAGWNGVSPYGLNTAYDIRPITFKSKANPMHWFEKSLGAVLRGFDTAGYMRAYKGQLRELGTLRAINEGLKGKALREAATRYALEADENMISLADEYGKYATFQDDTKLSGILQTVKSWLNAGKDFGFGDLVLKFVKTPANLIMRAIEYSPAGFMRSAGYLRQFYKYRNPADIANFEMSLARAIMGTVGFSGLGYILHDKGVLTTKGSEDYEVNSLERQSGIQPNSVNWTAIQRFIGGFDVNELELQEGDTFISFDWLQPIAVSIAIGAGINQSIKEEEELDLFKATKSAASSAVDTVLNMSVLRGLKGFATTYPGDDQIDRFARTSEGLASTFVPTLANQIRKYNDNAARETASPDFLSSMGNRAMNRVPLLEKKLPRAYDTLGKPKELYQDGTNSAFNVFFNPSYVSQYKPSPEEKVLLDYINRTGDKTAAPPTAPKSINVEGKDGKLSESVKLTGAEKAEYQRIVGEEIQKRLKAELNAIQNADPERAEKIIDDIFREARSEAREAIRAGRRK